MITYCPACNASLDYKPHSECPKCCHTDVDFTNRLITITAPVIDDREFTITAPARFAHAWARQYSDEIYEAPVTNYIKQTSFTHFYDIGAAFGYFSKLAAKKPDSPNVIALEGHALRYGNLLWNTRDLNIQTIYGVIGDPKNPTADGMVTKGTPDIVPQSNIPKVELRHLLYTFNLTARRNPHALFKIDIEGYEPEALKSIQTSLTSPIHPISFIIEYHLAFYPESTIDSFFPPSTWNSTILVPPPAHNPINLKKLFTLK